MRNQSADGKGLREMFRGLATKMAHRHQEVPPEPRIPNPESRIPKPESRIPNPEPRDPGNNNSTPLQGYLAHKIPPPPPGPPYEPRHGPTVGSYGVAVSYERGTPVGLNPCVIRHPTPGTRVPTLEIQPVIPPRSFRSFRF